MFIILGGLDQIIESRICFQIGIEEGNQIKRKKGIIT